MWPHQTARPGTAKVDEQRPLLDKPKYSSTGKHQTLIYTRRDKTFLYLSLSGGNVVVPAAWIEAIQGKASNRNKQQIK